MKKRYEKLMLVALLSGIASVSNAAVVMSGENQIPTMVYGEAENAVGGENAVLVKQAPNGANPLGNPINTDNQGENSWAETPQEMNEGMQNQAPILPKEGVFNDISQQNPSVSSEPDPAALSDKIQNTMYESGGRIYDIQSYPDSDVGKMESPEQPTIDNYPAY